MKLVVEVGVDGVHGIGWKPNMPAEIQQYDRLTSGVLLG